MKLYKFRKAALEGKLQDLLFVEQAVFEKNLKVTGKQITEMNKLIIHLLFISNILSGQKNSIPHLQKNENTTHLIVNDKPFLILGHEAHNSFTSGADNMRLIWE